MHAMIHEVIPIIKGGTRRLLGLSQTDLPRSRPQLILDDVIAIFEDQSHLLRRDHEPYFGQHCCYLQ